MPHPYVVLDTDNDIVSVGDTPQQAVLDLLKAQPNSVETLASLSVYQLIGAPRFTIGIERDR